MGPRVATPDPLVALAMPTYSERLLPSTYADDEPVAVGLAAAGSTPENPVYVSERLTLRAQALARAYDLHLLPTLFSGSVWRIGRLQAQALLEEIEFLAALVPSDSALASVLAVLQDATYRCAHDPSEPDLVIEAP